MGGVCLLKGSLHLLAICRRLSVPKGQGQVAPRYYLSFPVSLAMSLSMEPGSESGACHILVCSVGVYGEQNSALRNRTGVRMGIKGMEGRAARDGGGAQRLSATESRNMGGGGGQS